MEWLPLAIPILAAVAMYKMFPRRVVLWELLVGLLVGLISIGIAKAWGVSSQLSDTEWWGGWGVTAEYYEDWDEEWWETVDEYDEDGNWIGSHQEYHYDFHPAYYRLHDSNGNEHSISSAFFSDLAAKWGNKKFKDLHRDHAGNDGDLWTTRWPGDSESLEVVITTHTWENRVQNARTALNPPDVSDEEKKRFGLMDYPMPNARFKCPAILGANVPGKAEADVRLNVVNALLGRKKQVRLWILIFRNQPREAGLKQEWYWKKGNKNELVLCIGVNDQNHVLWAYPFSWTDSSGLLVNARSYVAAMEGGPPDLNAIVDWLNVNVERDWVRKQFKDFDFVEVPLPTWAHVLNWVLMILIVGGWYWWAITNEYDEDGNRIGRRRWSRYYR